jgi:hypothetical protein
MDFSHNLRFCVRTPPPPPSGATSTSERRASLASLVKAAGEAAIEVSADRKRLQRSLEDRVQQIRMLEEGSRMQRLRDTIQG